ncbi:alpha-2-macroglobulin family protein [Albibacillus kandeliae]
MKRFVLAALFTLVCGLFPAMSTRAQDAVPEFRYVVTRNMDFYGADLDALFDTDLQSCIRACSATSQCSAFTYNSRSRACFPKRAVSERKPYEGAISALRVATDPTTRDAARSRSAALGFLGESDLSEAARLGRELGLLHSAGDNDLATLLDAARARSAENKPVAAMAWTGAAVSLSDRADLWVDYAHRLLTLKGDQTHSERDYRQRALTAAINGYLRGDTPGIRASALFEMAQALEALGRGRAMIPALRLALDEQPRDDFERMLEEAIGKYGFRITDTRVDQDSATPRICAEFSEPLAKTGVDYEPYVQMPQSGLVVVAEGKDLCIDGVEHGQRYRVTFRKGLPAASGETTWKDVEVTQYVRDRSPSVSFPGRAYVLPKAADVALPVDTVNTATLDLALRKVSDRNLLRAVQDNYFGRPLSQWELETFSTEIAEEIWTGSADVGNELNRDMTTRLPMGEAIAGQAPGIYALTASIPGADPYEDAGATQWFVLTDLGISTVSGTDGLDVMVRGLSDAKARNGVEVRLVSRANAVLATATTDAEGIARFAAGLTRGTGGAAPAMVLANAGDDDFAFLSLTDPAFDLSDRGVEGRAPAGPVDVFLTTDRGAYRAGETIHATALSRDAGIKAIEGLPLIAILTRPDGVEYRRVVSDGGNAGGHVFDFATGPTVPRGTWRLDIKTDPKADAVATQTLLVEDFLPERIDYDLALPAGPIRPGDTPPLTVEARYLFGAPGADLSVEGQVVLRPTRTLAAWPGYVFGRHDSESTPRSGYFGGARTDAAGLATVALDLPQYDSEGRPLELTVIARVADGGARPVERRLTAPLLPDSAVIGIKPMFDDVVAEGTEAAFEVISLAPDMTPAPMRVKWTLNRVETRYQWYQLYGDWNWEPVTRRSRIATGEADLAGAPLSLSEKVDWGQYELVVESVGGDYTSASTTFYAGWYAPADSTATPDRLELSLDRPDYTVGDTATLRIVPRAAGTALISVLSNHVIHREAVEVPAGESRIPLSVTADWGTGAYVTATLIRPMDVAAGQNPARSMGVAHAAIAPGDKALTVSIDAPEVAEPRQTQEISVSVAGATEGDAVYLTLAAVDVGILNLSGFKSPDPQGYYFGQRRLGAELRDVYGRLIDGMNGAMGTVRSGGDADQGARLQSPPPTQDLVASFSGLVRVGADGTAKVAIPLPAFNGTVRLMAVAWSPRAVGQAERDMIVRDPVVVTASVPRFLAPGDQSRILLEVVHADGPSGEMSLSLANVGKELTIAQGPGTFTLGDKAKARFQIPVSASAVGDPSFDVVLTTPGGEVLTQTLRLPVRANDPVVSQTRRFALAAGDTFAFTDDVFAGLRTGTGRAILSAGPLARFDAPGLLNALDSYPYGCTEQVTSKALPLLYLSSVAQASGLGAGPDVQERVDAAIARVLTRQAPNGAFGLWQPESGDFWLDAYVSDFLTRARAEGYRVPDLPMRMALDNLRNRVNYAPDFDRGGEDVAYALLVLAREGAAAIADLRYYADVKGNSFATPLAAAQIGAALAAYGDQGRADMMFARAGQMLSQRQAEAPLWRADYGTDLRDSAAVLALATEAGSTALPTESLVQRVTGTDQRLSTQEASWTLIAAQALIKRPEESGLRVNGAAVTGPFVQVLEDDGSQRALAISSADGKATDITLTTMGIPEVAPEAGGTGYAIERRYYDMDGNAISGSEFAVGDRFVAVLTVKPFENSEARLMIDDPLPAGVEIDNPNLLRSGEVGALGWLQPTDARHAEFRSDRFIAAVDHYGTGTVTLAYIARAVTPGRFYHPAASVEDMYRPRYRARTGAGQLTVTE